LLATCRYRTVVRNLSEAASSYKYYQEVTNMSWKSLIIGCVAGAAIGAGAGMLYAPASGRATRAKIRDKAVGMGHDVAEFVDSKKTHLTNKMEGYKAKARKATEKLQSMVHAETDQREMAMAGEPTV
jgi:gas vesicle protein